jgi:hypothetical protein
MNFYPGSLDYMPLDIDAAEYCDIEDEVCIEEINEFVNKPNELT